MPTEAYPTLEELFFREDGEHRAVCTDEDAERAYCRDLAEVMLFTLLPEVPIPRPSFHVAPTPRYIVVD